MSSSSSREGTGWRLVANGNGNRPPPRSGHTLVGPNTSKAYLFGGFNGTHCFSDTWELNAGDGTGPVEWREIKPSPHAVAPPSSRASHGACWCDGYGMVILGGSGERFGYSSYDDVYIFDPKTERWLDITNQGYLEAKGKQVSDIRKFKQVIPYESTHMCFDMHSRPPGGYGRAIAFDSHAGLVWVFGGTDGTYYTNHIWCLNLELGVWARLIRFSGEPPSPRYLAKMVYLESGELVVIGGGVPPTCFASCAMDVFHLDLKTLTWSKAKGPPPVATSLTYPQARFAHTVSKLNDDVLFMFGGSARDINPLVAATIGPQFGGNIRAYPDAIMYSDAWLYHIKRNQWARITGYDGAPGPLDFVASAGLRDGKDVVVFGGFNKEERSNATVCFRFNMLVPSLESMCLKRLKEQRSQAPDTFPSTEDLTFFLPQGLLNAIFS